MADPVAHLLQSALTNFCDIEASAVPLLTAVHALRNLLRASVRADDLPAYFPQLSTDLSSAIEAATVQIAEAARQFIAPERTWLLLSSGAAGLVSHCRPELVAHRRLYVGSLIAELEAALCKQSISDHGDPLARLFQVTQALSAPAPSLALH